MSDAINSTISTVLGPLKEKSFSEKTSSCENDPVKASSSPKQASLPSFSKEEENLLTGISVYVDPKAKIIVQETKDSATGEILEKIPSKEVIDRYKRFQEETHSAEQNPQDQGENLENLSLFREIIK